MANPLASIDWGSKQSGSTIDVYFVPSGGQALYSYQGRFYAQPSNGWTAYEIQQAQLAFQQIANVANVQFNYVNAQSGAEMALTTIYDPDVNLGGYMMPPGEPFAGLGLFNTNALGWDASSPGSGGLEQGGESFRTLLHEFAHGMGLAHPHDAGGSSVKMAGVTAPFNDFGSYQLNQGIYTVMTYNSSWRTNPDGLPTVAGATYGHEGTMMALDIAVLQRKYGANMSHAAGDDVYTLPSSNGSGTFYACIWDAGGIDEIRADISSASTIDLRPATLQYAPGGGGYVSYSTGIKGGFTIANGVVIENATGSGFNDRLVGNGADNVLQGLGGNDALFGGAGNDSLYGGAGNDKLAGGGGNDTLHLGLGADRANGGNGADQIYAGLYERGDLVNGGRGYDQLHIDLDDADHFIGFKNGKLIIDGVRVGTNLESLDARAGSGNDVLKGAKFADTLDGGAGNDKLYGMGGNDHLIGGAGDDLLKGFGGADYFDFVALSGTDTVLDFTAADTAAFSTADLTDFSGFLGACTQTGADTVLTLASGTVIFAGLAIGDFTTDQFDFV